MVWAYHNLFTIHPHWTTPEGFLFPLVITNKASMWKNAFIYLRKKKKLPKKVIAGLHSIAFYNYVFEPVNSLITVLVTWLWAS